MTEGSPLWGALGMLGSLDARVLEVVGLSLAASSLATAAATVVGLPAALALGLGRFRGRRLLRAVVRSLMMVPAVLIGLLVYLLLGRGGPFGGLEWLYTPWAIVVAQALLGLPLATALFVSAFESVDPLLLDAIRTSGAGPWWTARAAVRQAAPALFAGGLTAFARVIGETGMTLMVGGNILGQTRTMTTAIATETMRGEFELAIALGIVLLGLSLVVNVALLLLEPRADARAR
ncbi:MAG: ABC transporter permease [Deltaproteobacteria bacterium]|nr:ABC transporter permease [Deltaproteobacteria bacterium]